MECDINGRTYLVESDLAPTDSPQVEDPFAKIVRDQQQEAPNDKGWKEFLDNQQGRDQEFERYYGRPPGPGENLPGSVGAQSESVPPIFQRYLQDDPFYLPKYLPKVLRSWWENRS